MICIHLRVEVYFRPKEERQSHRTQATGERLLQKYACVEDIRHRVGCLEKEISYRKMLVEEMTYRGKSCVNKGRKLQREACVDKEISYKGMLAWRTTNTREGNLDG